MQQGWLSQSLLQRRGSQTDAPALCQIKRAQNGRTSIRRRRISYHGQQHADISQISQAQSDKGSLSGEVTFAARLRVTCMRSGGWLSPRSRTPHRSQTRLPKTHTFCFTIFLSSPKPPATTQANTSELAHSSTRLFQIWLFLRRHRSG